MSKRNLLKKLACVLLCMGLAGKGLIAQKNYGNPVAETEVRSYFTTHATQYGLQAAELNSIKITSDYTEPVTGIRHIYVQQQFNGLDVVNASAALHLMKNGVPAFATYQFAKLAGATGSFAAFTPATAVQKAMADVQMPVAANLVVKEATSGTDSKTIFKAAGTTWDIPVRKAYLINETSNKLTAVWEVQLYRRDLQNYWIIYLDGTTGKVISKTDMVVKCDFGHGHFETDEFPNNAGPVAKAPSVTLTTKSVQQSENVYRAGISPNTQLRVEDEQPTNNTTSGIVNSYRVFDKPYEAPNQAGASHALVNTGGNAIASPDGWHKVANATTFPYTQGNNVWAFQDPSPGPLGGVPSADPTRTAYNNTIYVPIADTFAPSPTEPFRFDYAMNPNNDPTTYQKAAIVNLFYWNNLMHDVFYQFGFNEANRNFEASHTFSTGTKSGGVAGDFVLAQAQDGGGTNNANFLTLADGVGGQMQMYLWTGSTPDSIVRITSSTVPPPAAGKKYFSVQGSFGNSVTGTPDLFNNPVLNKPYVLVQKSALSTIGASSEGCSTGQMSVAFPPANDVNGKIVLIDRGNCSFVEKVLGAQLGGAAGVIVINNVPGAAPTAMGGTDAPTNAIVIPAVMITYEAGLELKNALANGATIVGSLQKSVASPKRDGDLDNGVVSHEYGHGISTRLTAGGPAPTGKLGGAEQGGEGWSDNFALYMTTTHNDLQAPTAAHPNGILPNRGIGSYVVYQPHVGGLGIREYQYSIDLNVNPATFGYAKLPAYSEAHSIGFLWCTMLYDMEQVLIDKYGFNDDVYNAATPNAQHNVPAGAGGNNVAMNLVMEGLMLQPANPTFIQQRDAILKADTVLYNGQHACILWQAFAKRGLGYSAVSGTNALGDEVEQFNSNPICNPQSLLSITKTADAIVNNNDVINYTITATNITSIALAATNLTVTDTLPPYTTYISSDGGSYSNGVISWPLQSLAQNGTVTHTVRLQVSHPTPARLILTEDNEGTTANNKFSSSSADVGALQQFNLINDATRNNSKVWYVQDYDVPGSNATLRLKAAIAIPAGGAQLIFNHKYASEASYDGGVIEISTDNTNWTPLPIASFSKNGYNGAISMTNNPLIGTATLNAFTGSSPGYIQSIASLGAYAGQSIYIRFRFTSDPTGGSVTNGGWWIDEVYLASPATFVTNRAAAIATNATNGVNTTASTLVIEPVILPIAGLKELKATVRNKTIVLNWETIFEKDNRGFEVLRKAPNEADFKTVGFVNGAGNSNAIIPYTFSDATATKGILYLYKLKQIDYASKVQYSNTVSARIVDQAFAFSFSPNPAHSSITFNINNENRSAISIEITDVTGKKVKTIQAGNESYISTQLSLEGFAKGVYLVSIRSGNSYETQKLVVE